ATRRTPPRSTAQPLARNAHTPTQPTAPTAPSNAFAPADKELSADSSPVRRAVAATRANHHAAPAAAAACRLQRAQRPRPGPGAPEPNLSGPLLFYRPVNSSVERTAKKDRPLTLWSASSQSDWGSRPVHTAYCSRGDSTQHPTSAPSGRRAIA